MSCDCTEKISALIDGELTTIEVREVERHLVGCEECQQVRADFLKLRSQINTFEATLEPQIQRQTLAKILSSGRRKVAPTFAEQPQRSWAFNPAVIAFATVILVGLVIGLLSYQFSNSTAPQIAGDIPKPAPSPSVADSGPKPATSPTVDDTNATAPADSKSKSDTPKDSGKGNENGSQPPRTEPTPSRRRPAPLVREPRPGEQFATNTEPVRSADAQTLTAIHLEKSETLLRAFRNLRVDEPGTSVEVDYERQRAQELVYRNMMLRREADASGDVQVATLLESLEPILLDIANLPDEPDQDAVQIIKERVERKNIVALLQVNSTALARAVD